MAKKQKRETFSEIVSSLGGPSKGPKKLTPETKLPYVFDLIWDAKTVEDLIRFRLFCSPLVIQHLTQEGFDIKSIRDEWKF